MYRHFINLVPDFDHKYFIAFSGIDRGIIQPEELFIAKISKWKSTHGISFITVGSHIPLKNVDLVIKALNRIKDTIEWSYTLVGEGPETSNLKLLCQDLRIENKVIFRGRLAHSIVLEELRKADIFILVSAPETFGLSYLEAMASGCIVVGSKGWGIDGVIKDGVNGFLCEPNNEHMLLSKLESILNMHEKELQQIALRCRRTICEYTEEKASTNYIDHISQCVKLYQ
jgi:glycosyltransferase involved in cell wall biosynthesis